MKRENDGARGWNPLAAVPELERRLAQNPHDAESHLRLAYIYEYHGRDDGKAKHHYLQHLLLTLGYPDADSALSALGKAAAGDGNNHMARIHIGTIHAYRDEFDEALEAMRAGTVWRTHESPHYRFNAVPGSTADGEMARIIEEREKSMFEILDLFSLAHPPANPIVYYFYESRIHKALLTGDQMPAHALPRKGEVHSIYGSEFRRPGLHEDVHVILRQLGRPPKLLEEGAALYADCRHGVAFPCDDETIRAVPGVVSSLLGGEAFSDGEDSRPYAVAASFVGFLIETFGLERFKALYGSYGRDLDSEMRSLYGAGLNDLEAAWLERVCGIERRGREGEGKRAGS